jgi:hypothetical protein
METTPQQLEEILGRVVDSRIDSLVTRDEFAQRLDNVDTKLDIIVGELADLK